MLSRWIPLLPVLLAAVLLTWAAPAPGQAVRDEPRERRAELFWLCECTTEGYPRLIRMLITGDGAIVHEQILQEFVALGDEEDLDRRCRLALRDTPGCSDTGDLRRAVPR